MVENALKTLRLKAGYTQRELANKIGVTQQAVASWEVGRTRPDIDSVTTLAKLYGVSVAYLMGEEKPANDMDFWALVYPDLPEVAEMLRKSVKTMEGSLLDKDGNLVIDADSDCIQYIRSTMDVALRQAATNAKEGINSVSITIPPRKEQNSG